MTDREPRPRPDHQLKEVTLTIDWERIIISGVNDAALGIIFAWLVEQVEDARND